MFEKFSTFLNDLVHPNRILMRLVVTDDGVALFGEDDALCWQFGWEDVTQIVTYKRDLGVVDMICVDFTVVAQTHRFVTHDEMQGFDLLTSKLPERFPTIAEGWWHRVAFPAFATNFSILY